MIPKPKTIQELLNQELELISTGNGVACGQENADIALLCMRIRNHEQVGLVAREAHANKSNPTDDSTWVTWF
ncbi:MAG TPA: hypothetical protein VIY48_17325 [Candidatus Paceibacterota bacterium]